MPNELISNKFKDLARRKFLKLANWRRNMHSLHRIIEEAAEIFPKQLVRDRIADRPHICAAIIEKNGGATMY